jgi:hypothetical protein
LLPSASAAPTPASPCPDAPPRLHRSGSPPPVHQSSYISVDDRDRSDRLFRSKLYCGSIPVVHKRSCPNYCIADRFQLVVQYTRISFSKLYIVDQSAYN